MSQEIFEIVKNMDPELLETQLALQCAPVLAGLKISNLLNVSKKQGELIQGLLAATELSCYVLLKNGHRMFILIYNKKMLKAYLSNKRVQSFLEEEGYGDLGLEEMLQLLSQRYQLHMEKRAGFPHELGVFLGYPMEDVEGFIENNGENFLCLGYWKVYQNQQIKQELFQKFERAKEWMILLVSNGMEFIEAVNLLKYGQLYQM
ncbi:MAG: DUF3793 family protein [Lachnospiraceae bacterium]|nr:DUF3793 family protein [Lachnospiraceae bacterium]